MLPITSSTVLANAQPAMQVQGPLLQAQALAVLNKAS